MKKLKQLEDLMYELGFQKLEVDGFDAFIGEGKAFRFFWWSNATYAAHHDVPRASLVVRDEHHQDVHIPLVEWPSEDQQPRPWKDVAEDIRKIVQQ